MSSAPSQTPFAAHDGLAPRFLAVRIELLVTFSVLAEELHFTRAAKALHLSQSGLSRRITMLERCLGIALLERSTRHVALTEAGQSVLPHALAGLHSVRSAATALAQPQFGVPHQPACGRNFSPVGGNTPDACAGGDSGMADEARHVAACDSPLTHKLVDPERSNPGLQPDQAWLPWGSRNGAQTCLAGTVRGGREHSRR